MIDRLRRDPGLLALAVAMIVTAALYLPTLGRGLTNYDDAWLIRDNWIVTDPSWASLRAIAFDLGRETRFVLGAEYLPVRDLSVMLDHVAWGDWYGGFHLTNLVLYLAAIVTWFGAMCAFGVDRRVAGLMALVWALHPSHAESVAWLTERKGLLAALLSGVAVLGFARYRAGARSWWLAVAALAAVAAVWSKAPAAFALAALAGLELVYPAHRRSWRRSAFGLGVIAVVGIAAFVPVVVVATDAAVIGTVDHAPDGWLAMSIGLHGFYVRLAAMAVANAASYPIATVGPSAIDLVIGAAVLAIVLAVAVVPTRGKWRPSADLRAAAILWLACWFPVSRLVLPLSNVLVADRYMLFATLGTALAVATGLVWIANARLRLLLVAAIVLAASLRTLDAQSNWRDSQTLWQRAVESNPHDGNAWSMYSDALLESGDPTRALEVLRVGLRHSRSPRLLLRKAIMTVRFGQRPDAVRTMREAAEAGEPRAMSNLALMLLEDGQLDEALAWARRGTTALPMYAAGHRSHGKVALAARQPEEALAAFEHAYALEPRYLGNRLNLGLALSELGRNDEARQHFEACLDDPALGARARAALHR